ncbi:DciA family protein [Pseudoalteromonas fenneropenaei]|uniref:DciA family protein n=1 Tax=Pseudoalteromonas fenneropenaei TaxID=1737459 RepID=A0ABV7CKK8_9GAMM
MAKNRYAPKALDEVFATLQDRGKMQRYATQSAQQAQWQALLQQILGPIIGKKCRVSHYREGILFIEAASPTLATRLQYLKGDLLSGFRANGLPDCASLKITSSPEAQTRLQKANRVKESSASYQSGQEQNTRQLSEATAAQLEALAQQAPPSLRAKFLKLAALADKHKK